MATVYIETSVPSYYFETRRSAQAIAWRERTRLWWSRHRARYELVTSDYVLNELAAAPRAKSGPGLAMMEGLRLLEMTPRIGEIIGVYIGEKVMPADAVGDAAHLAACSHHGIDFLLTWNCRHLANANKVGHIRAVNQRLGLSVPVVTTPMNLDPEPLP